MTTQLLERAVSSLWEAAIEPSQWSDALGRLGAAMSGPGACVLSPNPKVGCLVNEELTAAFDLYFKDGWDELDLRRRGISRLQQGQVLTDDDVVSSRDIDASPYYSEFLPHIGLTWWMGAGFHSGENFYCLAVQRGTGQRKFTSEEKAIFGTIRPTLSQLGKLLDVMQKTTIGTTLSALEKLSQAAICMTADGKVIDWNKHAEKLFDRDFDIHGRRIVIADKHAAQELASALCDCLSSASYNGFVIAPRSNRRSLLLRFSRLHPVVQSSFFGAPILMSIKEMAPPNITNPAILTKAYGLTQAEAQLASFLARGQSLDAAAEALCVSKDTARSHLKAVFAKTETHRQGELVAVLAGI